MDFFSDLPTIPRLRPSFNVGAGLDIPTGAYHTGINGESVLNGGLSHILSIAGFGNSFKSVIVNYFHMSTCERIKAYQLSVYDSESSLTYDRVSGLAQRFNRLKDIDFGSPDIAPNDVKISVTSNAEMYGDVYFDKMKKLAAYKVKNKNNKAIQLTTPFLDKTGKHMKMMVPTGSSLDSLSELKFSTTEAKTIDKNLIGESGNNMYYGRMGLNKKLLISQLPKLCVDASMYFTMVSHVTDEFGEVDPRAPKKNRLPHQKKGSDYKGVSNEFKIINYAIWEIMGTTSLDNGYDSASGKKTGVLYPSCEGDRHEGCTDLVKATLRLTRNKNGATGTTVDIILSQREGVLPHLSQFHYIRGEKGNTWGITGDLSRCTFALCPEITLTRTTVRNLIDKHANLRRGLEIASEMLQIKQLWLPLPDGLMCTPEELYKDIIALGYKWDDILNTRGYWVPLEQESEELPFLSTLDVLRLRKGLYIPTWLKRDDNRAAA